MVPLVRDRGPYRGSLPVRPRNDARVFLCARFGVDLLKVHHPLRDHTGPFRKGGAIRPRLSQWHQFVRQCHQPAFHGRSSSQRKLIHSFAASTRRGEGHYDCSLLRRVLVYRVEKQGADTALLLGTQFYGSQIAAGHPARHPERQGRRSSRGQVANNCDAVYPPNSPRIYPGVLNEESSFTPVYGGSKTRS